jgi:hypothetical protein
MSIKANLSVISDKGRHRHTAADGLQTWEGIWYSPRQDHRGDRYDRVPWAGQFTNFPIRESLN